MRRPASPPAPVALSRGDALLLLYDLIKQGEALEQQAEQEAQQEQEEKATEERRERKQPAPRPKQRAEDTDRAA